MFYPPESVLFETLEYDWALAYVLIYNDENRNQSLDDGELIGGAPEQGLLYSSRELSAEDSPTGQRLPAGFHVIPMPLLCEPKPEIEGQDCNVELGAPAKLRQTVVQVIASGMWMVFISPMVIAPYWRITQRRACQRAVW